jgi:hypothetical protein
MAKRNKTVVTNIKDLFLDEYYTDARAAEVMKLSIWPLVVAAYNATDGGVRISHIQSGWATEENYQAVELALPQGFNIARVSRYDGTDEVGDPKPMFVVSVRGNYAADRSSNSFANELATANIRYAIAKVSSGDHAIRQSLRSMVQGLGITLNDKFRSITDKLVDTLYGESVAHKPYVSLDPYVATYATRFFTGDIMKADIPAHMCAMLNKEFSKYKTEAERFEKAINGSLESMSGYKWALYSGINGGVIVGKVNMMGVIAALNEYRTEGCLPHGHQFTFFVLSDMPVPFRWYPSLEAMPEDQRREVEIQLVMLKAHVGHDTLLPSPDKYRNANKVWDAIGAACHSGWNTECPMFLLNG